MRKHRILKIVILVVVAALLCAVFIYLGTGNYGASDAAKDALTSGGGVTVTQTDQAISFIPDSNPGNNALIFYPGGKVDAEAYALLARDVAAQGVSCFIVKMPFDLAVFNSGGAKGVIDQNPGTQNWYIGGHSLGGVMAANYAAKDERIKGIVFLASYPNSDLSASGLKAISLTASEDQVLNWDKYNEALVDFPADTLYQEIDGGNHSGFGSCGHQKGDGEALIPNKQQQQIAADAIVDWIASQSNA